MKPTEYLEEILNELQESAKLIDEQELQEAKAFIMQANRVFVAGMGRSGYAARAFSNRLMHLGISTFFVGEATTPAIAKGDLLVIGSGSGTTGSLVSMANKAKDIGADIATITIFPQATIGKLAKVCIRIPGATPKSQEENVFQSKQPLGSAFEQMSWLVYDVLIQMIMGEKGISVEEMFSRHANLE